MKKYIPVLLPSDDSLWPDIHSDRQAILGIFNTLEEAKIVSKSHKAFDGREHLVDQEIRWFRIFEVEDGCN